ncbi:hypothetical protein SAMN04488168_11135 [Bacillus sp. 491mf]|uniref:hypothetical protein n=1 Tax=Bacillus TaxID=1386 RepID=UPI0008E77436|nr:hypothetical protein [Bacillus sp. 491mf]SFC87959.1 hypothetical protein SAMN04488168_11135 [Bacillus sp. 491mf]
MRKTLPIFFFILMILAGCNSNTVNSSLYKGKSLNIGIIGNAPQVREENVKFTTITLNELEEGKTLASKFDAVFIMKEHLSEAADSKYAKVYKETGIPFFFIETKKSYIPFVYEKVSYEDFPKVESGEYATGYFQEGENIQSWGFGLYNDNVNEANIKDVYTRIFSTIESLKIRS